MFGLKFLILCFISRLPKKIWLVYY